MVGRGDPGDPTETSDRDRARRSVHRLTATPRGTYKLRRGGTCVMDQKTPVTHGSRTMLYFLAGITAGAAVALLTAPQSGRETRRKLKQVKDDVTDRASRVGAAIGE